MEIDCHPAKRDWTLAERGIDFVELLIGFVDAEPKSRSMISRTTAKPATTRSPASALEFSISHIPSAQRLPGSFQRQWARVPDTNE
jgi:hypothetical protein